MKTCSNKYMLFDFLVSRSLIRTLRLVPNNQLETLALSILFDDPQLLEERKSSHLTHSVSKENQIRFALVSRIECSLRPLAKRTAHFLEKRSDVHLPNSPNLMPGDQFFINLVAEYLTQKPTWDDLPTDRQIDLTCIGPTEVKVVQLIDQVPGCNKTLKLVLKLANSLLYSGNYWTAKNILEYLHTFSPLDPELNYSLGIVSNFFNQPERAEFFFEETRKSSDSLMKIKAHYTLAMLYSRHHGRNRLNLNTSATYLEDAKHIILSTDNLKDRQFQFVFNRNGYALILFRQDRINEAISWLKYGIGALKDLKDEASNLHISVLQYNLCQCYQASNDLIRAEKAFHDLTELDPLFPEYRIDWGLLLCQKNDFEKALAQFQIAKHLNPYISESYQNIAYILLKLGDHLGAQATIDEGLNHLPDDSELLSQQLWIKEHKEKGA